MDEQQRSEIKKRLGRMAWLLDSSIPLPGTNFRFGVDGIIGLIPGVGDVVGAVLSSYILAEAARLGVPKTLLFRMGFNVAIETVLGAIPFVGDIFDLAWKANLRNVRLLATYAEQPRRVATKSKWLVFALAALLIIFIAAMLVLSILFLRWLFQELSN